MISFAEDTIVVKMANSTRAIATALKPRFIAMSKSGISPPLPITTAPRQKSIALIITALAIPEAAISLFVISFPRSAIRFPAISRFNAA